MPRGRRHKRRERRRGNERVWDRIGSAAALPRPGLRRSSTRTPGDRTWITSRGGRCRARVRLHRDHRDDLTRPHLQRPLHERLGCIEDPDPHPVMLESSRVERSWPGQARRSRCYRVVPLSAGEGHVSFTDLPGTVTRTAGSGRSPNVRLSAAYRPGRCGHVTPPQSGDLIRLCRNED
jgi:hypothetical protein